MNVVENLFKLVHEDKMPKNVILRGDCSYLEAELKTLIHKKSIALEQLECPKSGPGYDLLEKIQSAGGLFSSRKCIWIRNTLAHSRWNKKSKDLLADLLGLVEQEHDLFLIWSVDANSKAKWDFLEAECYELEVPQNRRLAWLKRMNRVHGALLDDTKLNFLSRLPGDLSEQNNHVLLWSLGGDTWAQQALGWVEGASNISSENLEQEQNLVFKWVDCILEGRRERAALLLGRLFQNDVDPFMLLALLAKSIRYLASLEAKGLMPIQPPFLKKKLAPLARHNQANKFLRGQRLLSRAVTIDRLLKSTRMEAKAALTTLC